METKVPKVQFSEDKKEEEGVLQSEENEEGESSSEEQSKTATPRENLIGILLGRLHTWVEETLSDKRFVVDPEGDKAFLWMAIVAIAVAFNAWLIILRIAFIELEEQSVSSSMFCLIDTICDVVYLLDIIVNLRMGYLEQGMLVVDPRKLSQNYCKKLSFRVDLLCLLPIGTLVPASDYFPSTTYRLHRLLKVYALETFFAVWDSRTSNPNRHRATKLTIYLAGVIHWTGCIYFMVSKYEGFGSNEWVYPDTFSVDSFYTKYIRVIYWSTVTLTTIGGTANPVTDLVWSAIAFSFKSWWAEEHVFMVVTFMVGVFLFATVVGNVGDVISNMNAARQEYQAKMDAIKFYMNHRQVPEKIQSRVKKWSNYAWSRTQALEDQQFLEFLPPRLRAEIAIHVHLETLQKVKIFEDCEEGFLRELVLRLRSQIYSPGDHICRSGEVGREMYIINHGKVQVVVTDAVTQERMVVATLSEGNYFGEISLLKLNEGQNRRTADVVSLGYSELLCLSKKDLMQALVEYPDAKDILEKHGRDRVNQNREAARLQRRKSECTISIPEGVRMLMKEKEKQAEQQGETRKSKTEKMWNKVYDKSVEWSELTKIIKSLRTFDSLATGKRIDELELKCEELTKKLAERDQQLLIAVRRFKELEEIISANMTKNGHNRPEGHQITILDKKMDQRTAVVSTNPEFETRVRRIQEVFESHIRRIYSAESRTRPTRVNDSDDDVITKASISVPERKMKQRRRRKSSRKFCNLSLSSDHSFSKTELTGLATAKGITTILIPGIQINDVMTQKPTSLKPKRSMNRKVLASIESREKCKTEGKWKKDDFGGQGTYSKWESSDTSDVINNNGAESTSSQCMEITGMSILSISPRNSLISSAEFTDASAFSDSSTDSDENS